MIVALWLFLEQRQQRRGQADRPQQIRRNGRLGIRQLTPSRSDSKPHDARIVDDDVQGREVDLEFVGEARDRVPVSDIEDGRLHAWIRRRCFVEQFFTAACDDNLVPLSVRKLLQERGQCRSPRL